MTYLQTHAPYIRSAESVPGIMWKTNAALLPAVLAMIFFSGWQALRILALVIAGAMLAEMAARKWAQKKHTLYDGSAVLTGLILTFFLPVLAPSWLVFIVAFTAVFLGKEFFGGLGANPFNPAMVGAALFSVLFSQTWIPMGDVCAVFFLLGAAVLVWQKLINWGIPLIYLACHFFLLILNGHAGRADFISGILYLTAFFVTTDSVTLPISLNGRRASAILTALLGCICARQVGYSKGIAFAILLTNASSSWLDYLFNRKKAGRRG